ILGKFDKNANGYLDKDERKAAREFLKTQPAGGRGGRGGFGGGPGGRGFDPASMTAEPVREGVDENKDGQITEEELIDGIKKFFGQADNGKRAMALDQNQLAEA